MTRERREHNHVNTESTRTRPRRENTHVNTESIRTPQSREPTCSTGCPRAALWERILKETDFNFNTFWKRSLLHCMIFTRNIKAFVQETSLPKSFKLKPFSHKTPPPNKTSPLPGASGQRRTDRPSIRNVTYEPPSRVIMRLARQA